MSVSTDDNLVVLVLLLTLPKTGDTRKDIRAAMIRDGMIKDFRKRLFDSINMGTGDDGIEDAIRFLRTGDPD